MIDYQCDKIIVSVQAWSRLVYLNEGCGMTRTQINIPHTRIEYRV